MAGRDGDPGHSGSIDGGKAGTSDVSSANVVSTAVVVERYDIVVDGDDDDG